MEKKNKEKSKDNKEWIKLRIEVIKKLKKCKNSEEFVEALNIIAMTVILGNKIHKEINNLFDKDL